MQKLFTRFKSILTLSLLLITSLALSGCGSEPTAQAPAKDQVLKIGVTAGPHAEIMDEVKKLAAKEGLNIEVVEFGDFVTPNVALANNELFANSMQHLPYLEATLKKEPKFKLVNVFNTVTFPMAVFSTTLKRGDAIPDGATVAIPNDPSNGSRALLLLADKELISVKDKTNVTTGLNDITANPHNFKFKEVDAASIPRNLPDVTIAVVNTNYAITAGLDPINGSLYTERADSPYVNIFVTNEQNKDDERIIKLQKLYQSAEIKAFIKDHFKGSVIAGF